MGSVVSGCGTLHNASSVFANSVIGQRGGLKVLGLASYGISAAAFFALALLLLCSGKSRGPGLMLAAACAVTGFWALVLLFTFQRPDVAVVWIELLELMKITLWLLFLAALLAPLRTASTLVRAFWFAALALPPVVIAYVLAVRLTLPQQPGLDGGFIMAGLGLSLLGLVLLEQLYRNLPRERRWAIKFLCLGLGLVFAFDVYLYSDAVLLQRLNLVAWEARGVVDALAVPLILIAARRNPDWAPPVFISRQVVFHTAVVAGAGGYLILISLGGFYIRDFGGTWGEFAQIVLVAAAVVGLSVMLFSGHARARLRVFVSKHFFSNKYDYREEWLRLTNRLADEKDGLAPYEKAVRVVADVFGSPAGAIWRREEDAGFVLAGRWAVRLPAGQVVPDDAPLVDFMQERKWVIDLAEFRRHPERYDGMTLPPWLSSLEQAWVVAPLLRQDELTGFMLLCRPEVNPDVTWEDRDLLKTLGRELAGYLGQHEYAQALSESRQFEAFNRLTAFLMHDLKNLIAQQSLVVKNAEKHKHNPEFVDDAMATIGSSVARMERLLEHLQRSQHRGVTERVDVRKLLAEAVERCGDRDPRPSLDVRGPDAFVEADREELTMVMMHLIRNAQDATLDSGRVSVSGDISEREARVRIEDTGEGMTEAFIRDHLFTPFYTTRASKGMGIGAHQARELARRLGGRLEVVSEPGRGSCFTLHLPCVALRADAHAGQA